ncbi:MAG: TSUP family transporter [Thermodesulfobacteriota bacterium]
MSYLVICGAALLVSGLTLFSGFGLGTLLMPVLALFFPVEMAVAATAVVHGANNVFKAALVGKLADKALVLKFGLPAAIAAFGGAGALVHVAHFGEIASYSLGTRTAVVTPVKLIMALLMLVFALFELLPSLRQLRLSSRHLFLGGLLSGFFGGFSGHQGALRSAFLAKVGISSPAFVGTSAVIGLMVDAARIAIYGTSFYHAGLAAPFSPEQWRLVTAASVAAFVGVLLGKRFLHKVTMAAIQRLTGILLLGIAVALGAGLL